MSDLRKSDCFKKSSFKSWGFSYIPVNRDILEFISDHFSTNLDRWYRILTFMILSESDWSHNFNRYNSSVHWATWCHRIMLWHTMLQKVLHICFQLFELSVSDMINKKSHQCILMSCLIGMKGCFSCHASNILTMICKPLYNKI